ncbi:MAG: DUF3239 domain-containing protein [Verrucomicrobiae bacterium]|nr:DUF3239 domain-containing protein [Verrucomicrobiae bacterium]
MTNRSIGEAGEFGRGSQASASTNFYPDTWRYLRFEYRFLDRDLLCFPIIGILSVLLGLALLKVHVALTILVVVIGGLPAILWTIVEGRKLIALKFGRENFKNGLLTAAIVNKTDPVELIHIAALSKGFGKIFYGIRKIPYPLFPESDLAPGKRIPCVSVFLDQKTHSATWHSFHPTPVIFGTQDRIKIGECLKYLETSKDDGDYFEILRTFLRNHEVADDKLTVYVCDDNGNLIETRNAKPEAATSGR